MKKLLVLFGLIFAIFACSNDCMNVDVPQKNSNKNNQSNTEDPGKRPTTLQDVVDNANAGEEIDLSDYELTSYTATVNKKLTIKNGSLNNAKLQITAENVKLEKLADLSVTSSSRLTINDSKLSNLLIGTSGETSRSTPSSSEMTLAMVTVTDSEIENVELNGFNSQLNITDTVTQIDDILISTKAKVILEAGSYDGMKDPTVTNGGEAVRVDMTKDTQLSVLSIYSSPQKLEYNIGDKIDLAGLIVMGTYSTNVETFKTGGWKGESLETITKWEDEKDYNVSDDFNTAGVSIVTVTSTKYPEIKCNFHVFVKDSQSGGTSQPEKEEIEITKIELRSFGTPKTLYKVGEKLDLSCYQVVGTYNGFEINLPFTSEPANGTPLTTENTQITFYYNGKSVGAKPISVTQPYTVTFKDGEKTLYTLEVADGELLKLPVVDERIGYTFDGWYNGETKIEAGYEVTENLTLTAKWNEENAYYVSNIGDDSKAGTYFAPFKTLQAAVNKVTEMNKVSSSSENAPYRILLLSDIEDTSTGEDIYTNDKSLISIKNYSNPELYLKIASYQNDSCFEIKGASGRRIMNIEEGANVTIENITLTGGNINDNGGGVYVAYNAIFTMGNGATISNCTGYNGGGVYVAGGKFNMSGGTISWSGNDYCAEKGGGVYMNDGTFNMSGSAKIEGCKTYSLGGGVYMNAGTFNMSGGTIGGETEGLGCTAEQGGGVYVQSGTFNMNGGTISDCIAEQDGGVYVLGGTFTMNGGAVISSGNDVYLANGTSVTVAGNLTGTTPVATITPNEYSTTRQVLVAGSDEVALSSSLVKQFNVTPDNDGNEWFIDSAGYLGKVPEKETETNNDGTVVYLMESYDNLLWIARELKTGSITSFNMKLTNDIEIPNGKWQFNQLDVNAASTIDGQGHSITINEDVSKFGNGAGGLFYKLNNSTVKNLVLMGSITANTTDTTEDGYIGALCRSAYRTTIQNVMSTVTIIDEGSGNAGGLVGIFGGNNGDGTTPATFIKNCAVYANISSENGTAGGLVGESWENTQTWKIENCIYMGAVSRKNGVAGALIGNENTGRTSYLTDIWYCESNGCAIFGKEGNAGNIEQSEVKSKSAEEIATEEAANLLNTNSDGTSNDAWEYVEGEAYPTLKSVN